MRWILQRGQFQFDCLWTLASFIINFDTVSMDSALALAFGCFSWSTFTKWKSQRRKAMQTATFSLCNLSSGPGWVRCSGQCSFQTRGVLLQRRLAGDHWSYVVYMWFTCLSCTSYIMYMTPIYLNIVHDLGIFLPFLMAIDCTYVICGNVASNMLPLTYWQSQGNNCEVENNWGEGGPTSYNRADFQVKPNMIEERFEKQGAKISHQIGFPSWNMCLHHAWDWVGASKFEWSRRWRT